MRHRPDSLPARLVVLACVVLTWAVVYAGSGRAQTSTGGSGRGLTGSVGVLGEAYSASGISNRRDGTSGLVYGRASSRGSELRYGFQFLLATEQSGSRQAMSRLSANMAYRFFALTAGDLSPVLSKFSVNGATVRGGSAELTYGPYLATFMYGRVRRAVEPTGTAVFGRPSYRQWLYAARVGAGESGGSHVHLIGLVARDQASSLADTVDAAPTENVSVSPDVGLSLFGDRLNLRATYTLSAYSADTRARTTDSGVSSMIGLFTPRVGSRIDYATDVSARLALRDFKMRASYERVQPGFRSLGLSQIRSDQAVFRVEPSLSIARRTGNIALRFRSSRNNLSGDRASTLKRRLVGVHGHVRLSRQVQLAAAYSNVNTRNDLEGGFALPGVADRRNVAQTIMLAPTFTLPSADRTHVITLNASYQFLRDRSPSTGTVTPEVKFDNVSATGAYSLAFSNGVALNLTAGLLSSTTPSTEADALTLSAGTSTSFLKRRASLSLTGGWSRNSLSLSGPDPEDLDARQLSLRLSGSYRIPDGSTIRLSARGLRNTGDLTGSFDELQVSLRIERRF